MSETDNPTVDTMISVAAHLESELEEALSPHRISRSSYLVLDLLERSGTDGLGQRQLIAAMRRTAGTVSVRLGRLERAGLIARSPHRHDRRSVTVTLTDPGRELLAAARPRYENRASRLLAGLPAQARQRMPAELTAWLAFLEPGAGDTPRLGVAVAGAATATRMRQAVGLPDVSGVLVLRVVTNGLAAAAGITRGDLITRAGGEEVQTVADLDRAVHGGEATVALELVRGAEVRTAAVNLS